jgi:hypothetical protein
MHYQRWKTHGDPTTTTVAPAGAGTITNGYRIFHTGGVMKKDHVLMAEKAIGKPLPAGAEVHHVNEIRSDNRPENLVVCPSRKYHALLHARTRAYDECGHADWRRCAICKQYDALDNLKQSQSTYYHRACRATYDIAFTAKRLQQRIARRSHADRP